MDTKTKTQKKKPQAKKTLHCPNCHWEINEPKVDRCPNCKAFFPGDPFVKFCRNGHKLDNRKEDKCPDCGSRTAPKYLRAYVICSFKHCRKYLQLDNFATQAGLTLCFWTFAKDKDKLFKNTEDYQTAYEYFCDESLPINHSKVTPWPIKPYRLKELLDKVHCFCGKYDWIIGHDEKITKELSRQDQERSEKSREKKGGGKDNFLETAAKTVGNLFKTKI